MTVFNIQLKHWLYLLPFLGAVTGLVWWTENDPFFWDTVQLGSKHAHFYYENRLKLLPLPADMDSGHPPFLGYYLAVIWTFFGKSLPVSHWAMLPFLLTIPIFLFRTGSAIASPRRAFWLIPLAFLDPVMAGQSVLVGPDIILVSFFLCALDGMLSKNRALLTVGILGLCLISMRGMMTASAFGLFEILAAFLAKPFNRQRLARQLGCFVPGAMAGALYLWWHYRKTGWIGFHQGSPWAPAFERTSLSGMFRTVLVLGWRWLDFGRAGEWLVLAGLVWYFKKQIKTAYSRTLILFICCLAVFLMPSAIVYNNLSAHRYFLPLYLSVHIFVWGLIVQSPATGLRKTWVLTGLVCLFAWSNCLVYPRGISMDWDSTLAHLPYHRLRRETVEYLQSRGAGFSTVGSAFPNLNTGENLLLNGDQRHFSDKNFDNNQFIVTSNIFNDFSPADYRILEHEGTWNLVRRYEGGPVWIEVYERSSLK
jgi:hypothetical protein